MAGPFQGVRPVFSSPGTSNVWQTAFHGDATVYHGAQIARLQRYQAGLAAGNYRPLLFPWDCLPAFYLVLALMFVPRLPRPYGSALRWLAIVAIHCHSLYIMRSCRAIGIMGGYEIGFLFSWVCIISFCLLIFSNVKTDFRRLEARPFTDGNESKEQANGSAKGSANGLANGSKGLTNGSADGSAASELRAVLSTGVYANGTTEPRQRHSKGEGNPVSLSTTRSDTPYQLEWQAYPSSLSHCLDWTLDLVTACRGVNWNFRSSTLPKLQQAGDHDHAISASRVKPRRSIQQIQKQALVDLVYSYLALDVMKALHSDDAFFSGLISFYDPPAPSAIYSTGTFASRLARLFITIFSVYTALSFLVQLGPIFFSMILPSIIPYPSMLRLTRTPLLTPSMYEPFWGPLFPSIASKGIAGFWGGFWHQLLRFGILQPSTYLIKRYNLDPASNATRTIQVLIAFCLSGVVHGLASYTSFPLVPHSTRPITWSFFFFMMQAIGIIVLAYVTRAIRSRSFPVPLRQMCNVVVVLVWLCISAPYLADDLARCGAWLFEPLPVSLVRGIRGQGWWRWDGSMYGWWSDPKGRWWESGFGLY